MRLGMHPDADDGEARFARRRHLRPEAHDWYAQDDVLPYSSPHPPRIHEIQMPDDRTPRGHARTLRNARSARSLDAYRTMPPPHLARAETDTYRRPREIRVYEEDVEDSENDRWQPGTRETSPEYARPRRSHQGHRGVREHRAPREHRATPEHRATLDRRAPLEHRATRDQRATREHRVPVPRIRRKQPEPLSQSALSTTESSSESDTSDEEDDDEEEEEEEEEESDEESDQDEIEVVEEPEEDEIKYHRRHLRHSSREDYIGSSEDKRLRARSLRRPSAKSLRHPSPEEEYEMPYRHVTSETNSPVRRRPLRRQASDSPSHHRRSRVLSIIESSRPPVSSRRTSKVYETRGDVRREGRPRQSNNIQAARLSRSHSRRRPHSLLESIFGGSSRQSSPERPPKLRDCIVCLDEVPSNKCPRLKCGHRMCNTCLRRNFKLSLNDPQQMPPKCCSEHIPLHHVDKLFDRSFKKTWNRKFAEYSTRNRVYCPMRKCGEWIKPANIHRDRDSGRKMARCGRCKTKVCVSCNGKWHHPRRCPRDDETARFLEQAKDEGWKRCYKCRAMVELKDGCNHMTCRCGAEFCMICGVKWKGCDCPWFSLDTPDSDHLDYMNGPIPMSRRELENGFHHDEPPSPGERRVGRGQPPVRPQPKSYEEEMALRQIQEQRDEEMARKLQYYEEDGYGPMGGVGDVAGVGNAPAHFMNGQYNHGAPQAPSIPSPTGRNGFDRGDPRNGHGGRARGIRGGSMERRLADRFSENRHMPGSMPGMEPPPMAHQMGPLMPPPPMGMPPPPMGMPPPPMGMPPPPMGMPPPMEMGYPGGRVVVEHDPNDYEDDGSFFSQGSHSRRSSRRSVTPKSSILAGLNGRGTGMGRVHSWRKYVEPGDFKEEIAFAAAHATAIASA